MNCKGMFACALLLWTVQAAPADDSRTTAPPPLQPPEYRLGPDDVLEVFVWKEPDLSTTTVVRPDGKISLPLINECDAVGRTVLELQQTIKERLSRFVSTPIVNVIVKEVKYPKISVIGQVRKPDQYRIVNRISVLDAIALAGGFTDYAKRDDVIVIRNGASGAQRIRLNLKKLVEDERAQMFYLQQYDTVYVK
jgi:polysaccharide export outer membrane protein